MSQMSLPSTITMQFKDTYDGFPAARFNNSCEASNFEAALRLENVSFRTKIVKHKRRGREFVVMLVEKFL